MTPVIIKQDSDKYVMANDHVTTEHKTVRFLSAISISIHSLLGFIIEMAP